MLQKISFLLRFFQYKFSAHHANGHGVHSPFLYNFIRNVLNEQGRWYAQNSISKLYKQLLKSTETLTVTDFGAGSKIMKSPERKISDIAYFSAVRPKYSELLFRMVKYFEPKTILELGTSLGIGTLSFALSNSKSTVYTIEGCPETAKFASKNFQKLNVKNIEQFTGEFSEQLPIVFQKFDNLDFAYIDGNHRGAATLNYFYECLKKAHEKSIFVFDDIHWSIDMQQAWNQIVSHPNITLSLDLFQFGIVFFNTELSKQHFIVKY